MKNALRMIDTTSRLIEQSNSITRELIAKRAHEKWQQRGCPLWEDEQDWFVAQSELEAEARDGARQKAPACGVAEEPALIPFAGSFSPEAPAARPTLGAAARR